ncbi:unnamed protein product [Trifolium pratense]|uniref:Uncharacterized protein n=1 Tax=Trifolium pratense TaxID=57577 RepID=A0ACB0M518_TRIPR|nr:unnamed protein product [Trifolium pratense]
MSIMTTKYSSPSNGRGWGRSNGRGRSRSQPQQHQWPLWTTPSYPRHQQQWSYPWQPLATPSYQAAMHTSSISSPDGQWYMDSGATSHMTGDGGNLTSYFNMSNDITVGNGHHIPVIGCGHVSLPNSLTLNNVLHAPKLIKNLVSVRKFTIDNDVSVEFDPFGFSVKDFQTGTLLMRCNSSGDLYPIPTRPNTTTLPPTALAASSTELWHSRLGHPGAPILNSLHRNKILLCNKFRNDFFCHSCPLGKQTKLPFYNSLSSTFMPFDIVHSDLWTSPVLSSGGHRYYVLFLDDFTDFLWTFPISNKSQVHSIFLQFSTYIKTQFEREIKCFQCDNGKEYDNALFHKFCELNGMSFRFSCPHTSPQNGKAERKIRTINNIIRTLLAHASIPPVFWHHALQMATYLHNILPNKKLTLQSPTKILYQQDPSYSYLRVFGCLCYPLIPSNTRNKLQPRSTSCVFLGYPSNHRGYKCYELSSRKIIISRHVIFEENTFPFSTMNAPTTTNYNFLDDGINPLLTSPLYTTSPPTSSPNITVTQSPSPTARQTPSPQTTHQTTSPPLTTAMSNNRLSQNLKVLG